MDDEIIIGVIDDVIIKGFAVQAGGPTTNIRLFLKAASLPKSTMTQQQPDVLARVLFLVPRDGSHPPPPPHGSVPLVAQRVRVQSGRPETVLEHAAQENTGVPQMV